MKKIVYVCETRVCEFHRVPVYELYIILPIFTFLHTLGLVYVYIF